MPALMSLPPIDAVIQKQTIALDFGQFLPSGVVLTGTPTVTLSVVSGVDATPSSRLSGLPKIGTVAPQQGGSGVANTAILQQLVGLLGGVTYLVTAYCTRSDGDIASGYCHVAGVAPV